MKRTLLAFFVGFCLLVAALAPVTTGQSRPPAFRVVEASIPEMRAALLLLLVLAFQGNAFADSPTRRPAPDLDADGDRIRAEFA